MTTNNKKNELSKSEKEHLIKNEKAYQRKKIINYTLILILILLLLKCGNLNDGTNKHPPIPVKENINFIEKNIKKEEPYVAPIIENKIIPQTNEKVILEISKFTEKIIPNNPVPVVITPPIIITDVPLGFENIIDTDKIDLYVNVVVNNVDKGIMNVEIDQEFIYIKNIEIFSHFLLDFKYKNEILSSVENDKLIHKINKKTYTSIFDKINETLYIDNFNHKVTLEENDKYLPISTTDFSLLQNLNISYYDDSVQDFNIGGELFATKGEHKLITNWNKSKDKLNVNHLYYNWENKEHNISTGYMNYSSSTNSLIKSNDFLGIKYKQNNNKINKKIINDFIIIEINHNSSVRFYKDEKLILTKRYEAGIHNISTDIFPEGNYILDIEIDNGSEVIKKQERIKNTTTSTGFNFDVGFLEKENKDILFDTKNELFFKSSYHFDINDNSNFTPEILYSEDSFVFNSNFYYSKNSFFLDSNILMGNKGAEGKNFNVGYDFNNHNFTYTYYDVENEDNLFVESYINNHKINYNYHNKNIGNINLFYSQSDIYNNNNKNEIYGAKYKNRYNINLKNTIDYEVAVSKNKEESVFWLQLTYRFNDQNKSFYSSLRNNNGEYSNNNKFSKKRDFNNYHEKITGSASFYDNSDNSYQLGYQIKNENYGYFEHDFYYQNKLSYYGNASTNIGYNDSTIGFGGDNNQDSGILVHIESDINTYFYITINKHKRKIVSNADVFIPLNPYDEFNLIIEPIESNISQKIKNPQKTFTLSKGNIKKFNWTVNNTKLLIGTLYDNKGNILDNESFIFDNNYYFSDNEGLINLSVSEGVNLFQFENFTCNVMVDNNKEIIFNDKIVCKEEKKK